MRGAAGLSGGPFPMAEGLCIKGKEKTSIPPAVILDKLHWE